MLGASRQPSNLSRGLPGVINAASARPRQTQTVVLTDFKSPFGR